MHVYAVTGVGFYATQSLLHAAAREVTAPDPEIVLIDIDVDKSAILALLNQQPMPYRLIKSFELTPRGGLVEIDEAKKTALDARRAIPQEPDLSDRSVRDPFDIWQEVWGGTLVRPAPTALREDMEDPDSPSSPELRDGPNVQNDTPNGTSCDPDNGSDGDESHTDHPSAE